MNNQPVIRPWERLYLNVLLRLRQKQKQGFWRGNRTGVRTAGGFGLQLDVPLNANFFPALLTKSVHLHSVTHELLWFLRGDTNVRYLQENNVRIWDEWADEYGDLGPVYGQQWRAWRTERSVIDQVAKMIEDLQVRPDSRRIIVSAWNPAVLPLDDLSPRDNARIDRQALAPCHMLFQAYVEPLFAQHRLDLAEGIIPEGVRTAAEFNQMKPEEVHNLLDQYQIPTRGLSLRVDQRSADWFLGVPFNIASYALLTHLLCTQVDNLAPLKLTMQFGDYHLYEHHAEQADEQLKRFESLFRAGAPTDLAYPKRFESLLSAGAPTDLAYPKLKFNLGDERHPLETLEGEDILFEGYRNMGKISAVVAV